jgi:hypothetical protein
MVMVTAKGTLNKTGLPGTRDSQAVQPQSFINHVNSFHVSAIQEWDIGVF